jgi:hypothetical protein
MHVAIIALVCLGVLWALSISRGFRIGVAVLAVGGIVWFTVATDRAEKQKDVDAAATQQSEAKEKQRQAELWSMVSPKQVELRNPQLSPNKGAFSDDEFKLTGSIKNLSNQQLGAFEIDVTARDCTEKCEIIGRTSEIVWVDIPPQQVRGVSGKVSLVQLPQLRGKFVPQFEIKRVYAGDLMDYWGVHKD